MGEFRLKHGPASDLPSSLPEGDHFIVTSDSGSPVNPPEMYIGPDGGGTPVQVSPSYDESSVNITGGSIDGVNITDSDFVSKSGTMGGDSSVDFTVKTGEAIVKLERHNLARVLFRTDGGNPATAFISKVDDLSGAITFDVTTGSLSGTTGTNGNFTISVEAVDGSDNMNMYLENRVGGVVTFEVVVL